MQSKSWRSFLEARAYVHTLKLGGYRKWKQYCKSGKKPDDIPATPDNIYKKEWKGWGDWFGTGNTPTWLQKYRPFAEARKFVHHLGLKNNKEWREYCRSGKKPTDIPANPNRTYKAKWKGYGDWLGTGSISTHLQEYRPFEKARKFVHTLKLRSGTEWKRYCKSGKKPIDIPANPRIYEAKWKTMGDWLGTGYIANYYRKHRSFEEAREFVHTLGLKSSKEWNRYRKSGKRPSDIPTNPNTAYKKAWKGWGDWLGTGRIADQYRVYRQFEDARKFVHTLGLKSIEEWREYCRSGKKPSDIPYKPSRTYKKDWKGDNDWLGYEETKWSVKRVKELLHDLIESRIIYEWSEAVLYSFLLRKGLLNLEGNRHAQFFKDLIEAARTEEGRRAMEQYAFSDSETPPDLSKLGSTTQIDPEEEIQKVSSQELAQLVESTEPLDYGRITSAKQILADTIILESINVDQEAMRFYLDYSIEELWKAAFRNEEKTVQTVRREGNNGNKYHDAVVNTFLSDYDGAQNVTIPKGYTFPYPPTLMQLYVAYKIHTTSYFANFSGTGAGKTLSAILASRVINSKMTLIVCPNDVVNQWSDGIAEAFPNSEVKTGKESFYTQYDENKCQYLVLNYDKFSQEYSPNLILNLTNQKVDFVVLDEVHFVKKRDEDSSLRRRNLDGLMTAVRKKNTHVKVLSLSATPVINNLMEGRSLLELMTGKIYDDVATKSTIPNAVTLYEKLSMNSIRELPQYDVDIHTDHVEVQAEKPQAISINHLKSNPLEIEQFLTDAKISEIVRLLENQTIIYTEYVTEVIEKLSRAVADAGYTYALYTGFDRSGLRRFLDKKVQILIASRPISTGVDGLQHICNRLIINTLPWTNAQYQQLLGRLVRKGQIRDVVHVYVIKASISGYPYDKLKWNRIQFKRTLADCAVDGRLPEKNLVTPQQAAMEAVRWLERLERGEISSVVRRDLHVELTPVEIRERVRKYGDFTRLNNQINNENSETTHNRMLSDPREWEEYHRQYREARKGWVIIPYDEIIKRIKQLFTSRMLARLQIGDFGCGEAKIMEAFGSERVYSFDHIAINNKVTACDMKNTGLPDDVLDVVVFSLSLMGRNWSDYIMEAKRCLAINGYLLIVETTKSLKTRLANLRGILEQQGFEIYSDKERGDFTFIEAREV
jgi:superfamily II DNA or RNA helicase